MILRNDLEVTQWIFDCEFMMNFFNGPIDVQEMCDRIRRLHKTSVSEPGSAEAVRKAWEELAATVGHRFAGQFIACGVWREICPSPRPCGDTASIATLWSQGPRMVRARVVWDRGRASRIDFCVE